MSSLYLDTFAEAQRRPVLETHPSTEKLWTDPYIAKQMLQAHLNSEQEAASYKPDLICNAVDWMHDHFKLDARSQYLDLGCGPGLYTQKMANLGVQVTGIDFSENSLSYARSRAEESGLTIDYRRMNYLDLKFESQFDLATIIWCDINVFAQSDRSLFLNNVHRALKDDGAFLFDFDNDVHFAKVHEQSSWTYVDNNGFFSAEPHVVLENRFKYTDELTICDRTAVLTEGKPPDEFFLWHHFYSLDDMTAILEQAGFLVHEVFDRIDGLPYSGSSEKITLVAIKMK